ncbi:hypothetical protein D3C77_606870 [compost metagenome]
MTDSKNSPSGLAFCSRTGSFTIKMTKTKEARHKTGIAKKGTYQIHAPSRAPSIGLSTLPNVLDVSIMPRLWLTSSSSSNMSPTSGSTIGNAPAAPMPCSKRPATMIQYTVIPSANQLATPATAPPAPATIKLGIMIFFLPNLSDK